tara:strand:- start:563 stop:883 length:321 start_codon:yes stop_codon:yes gene_type:complete
MSNVLTFPASDAAETNLRNQMNKQVESLEDIYELLDAMHSKMHDLEKECAEIEVEFDANLEKYARKVGVQNVEVEFLGYTSRHKVSIDADGENFTLAIQEGILDED